jgi:hypothetical protein
MRKAGLLQQLGNIGNDIKVGFDKEKGIGPEDNRRAHYRELELQGKQADAPKWDQMMGAYPLGNRIKELFGKASPERIQAEKEMGISLAPADKPAQRLGQLGGALVNDIKEDGTRSFYWLLNALQASGSVINDEVIKRANRMAHGEHGPKNLWGKSTVMNDLNPEAPLRVKNSAQAIAQGAAKKINGKTVPARNYSIAGTGDDAVYQKRNFQPGDIGWLSVPTGIAINSGLGLLTPFGGAEGYKAAIPSEEDPSKTDNVLGEVALKYFMGRTGNLLPYDEFKKVRPDVSKDEYNRYQAFKYDKREDWNPLDGDMTILGGGIKTTDEGIHGPELQFLGRSLPVTTGGIPFITSALGGAAGTMTQAPIKGGIRGGLAGLVGGQLIGNAIESERRRRNKEENDRQYNKENNTLM